MKTENSTTEPQRDGASEQNNCVSGTFDPNFGKDFSADHSGADLIGAEINAKKFGLKGKLNLDGLYTGANFTGAVLSRCLLSGGFSDTIFDGAQLDSCELTGNFDRTKGLGPALSASIVQPTATFRGADLRGIPRSLWKEIILTERQIEGAVILFSDRLPILTGQKVKVLGCAYRLLRPAQCLNTVHIEGWPTDDLKLGSLDIALVDNVIRRDGDRNAGFLFDVAGLTTELLGRSRLPAFKDSSDNYFLYAPGVIFKEFRNVHRMDLAGDFSQACLRDSEINSLSLRWGSFREFDITGAQIKHLSLNLNTIDAEGLKFSDQVETVSFLWDVGKKFNSFTADPASARRVIEAWNSASECESLALCFLKRPKSPGRPDPWKVFIRRNCCKPINPQTLLASKGVMINRMGGKWTGYGTDESMCYGLIARRNQLLSASYIHRRR